MKFLIYTLILIVAIITIGYFFKKDREFEYETPSNENEEMEVFETKEEEPDSTDEDKAEEVKEEAEVFETKEEEGAVSEKNLKEIVYGFLGTPYKRGPLGEDQGEKIYRTDVFDCTTLVLISASKYNSNGKTAEEMMKIANYHPAEVISYETRLHFTTYRNLVSPFFEDITHEVGENLTKEKVVILNRERNEKGRLIDIDWQEEIILRYIKKEDIHKIKSNIPAEVGVAFVVNGDEDMGLDVRHEGFVFDGHELIHASSQRGEVYKEDFLKFIENSNYSGVLFFKLTR